jgi:hypothetical protein
MKSINVKGLNTVNGHFSKALDVFNDGAANVLGIETDQDTVEEKKKRSKEEVVGSSVCP